MTFQGRDDALRLRRALFDPRKLCAALGLLSGAKPQARGLLVHCPWHAEKHASCSVTLGQDGTVRVHCFTCLESGDALTLIARVRELDGKTQFREVLAEAARIAGSEPAGHYEPVPAPRSPTLDAASYSAVAARLLEFCTLEKERDALRYLERRKLHDVSCQAGVSALPPPRNQDALIQALLRDFEPATLELAGLVRKGQRFVHPFHRLIIPWRGRDGSVDVLQRRRVDDAEPKKKYVLPPGRRPFLPFGAEQLRTYTAATSNDKSGRANRSRPSSLRVSSSVRRSTGTNSMVTGEYCAKAACPRSESQYFERIRSWRDVARSRTRLQLRSRASRTFCQPQAVVGQLVTQARRDPRPRQWRAQVRRVQFRREREFDYARPI